MGRFPGPIACGAMHHLCSASATAWSISHYFVEDTLVSVADAAAMLTDLVLMPGCTPRPGAGAEKVGVAQMPQLNHSSGNLWGRGVTEPGSLRSLILVRPAPHGPGAFCASEIPLWHFNFSIDLRGAELWKRPRWGSMAAPQRESRRAKSMESGRGGRFLTGKGEGRGRGGSGRGTARPVPVMCSLQAGERAKERATATKELAPQPGSVP